MTSRLPLAALVAAVLALTLSACGDDETVPSSSDSTTAPTDESSTTATEPTVEPTTEAPTETPTPEPTEEPTEVDLSQPPATYDDALAHFDALGQEPLETIRFETTTGIYCLLDSDFVIGCELPAGGMIPAPELCGDGPSQDVGRIEMLDGDPQPVCNSDTIREAGAKTLALDAVAESSATGIRCLSEEIGVTCIDLNSTRGFFLGAGAYTVFTAG